MNYLDDLRMPHGLTSVDTVTTDNTARAEMLSRIDWSGQYAVTTDGKVIPTKYLVSSDRVIINDQVPDDVKRERIER